MPASQHQSPKSDIEISQTATKRRILDVAKDRLGVEASNLDPYGHYKAKVSMDFVKSLKDKPSGKLILVTAISPTPAGEGKTTTTVGLTDALPRLAPISRSDALEMMSELRGKELFEGFRGMRTVDREALAAVLGTVGSVLRSCPEIKEIEINPLRATSTSLMALDALILT